MTVLRYGLASAVIATLIHNVAAGGITSKLQVHVSGREEIELRCRATKVSCANAFLALAVTRLHTFLRCTKSLTCVFSAEFTCTIANTLTPLLSDPKLSFQEWRIRPS